MKGVIPMNTMDAKTLRRYRNLRHRILDRGQYRIQSTAAYKELDARFREFVLGIGDPVEKRIVELYYRDVRSFIWIADKEHYSESQIKRIKRRAIGGGK